MGRFVLKPVVEVLLSGLVDYAGLFPPAGLAMPEAVRRYAEYRRGPHAWMLGRFVVPASRLHELESELARIGPDESASTPWLVSALVGADATADAEAIAGFNEREAHARSRPACVDCVEVKATTRSDVVRLVQTFPSPSGIWCEVPVGPSLDEVLQEVAFLGAGAKLRTGGVTADAVPGPEAVARFLLSCARTGARWKATAGLHHAIRGSHRLTYEADSASAVMHGFLNVFLAAVLASQAAEETGHEGGSGPAAEAAVAALLEERDAQAFVWEAHAIRWRTHRFGIEAIRGIRERFARSFGSCSFVEPLHDLAAYGIIDDAALTA